MYFAEIGQGASAVLCSPCQMAEWRYNDDVHVAPPRDAANSSYSRHYSHTTRTSTNSMQYTHYYTLLIRGRERLLRLRANLVMPCWIATFRTQTHCRRSHLSLRSLGMLNNHLQIVTGYRGRSGDCTLGMELLQHVSLPPNPSLLVYAPKQPRKQ